MKYDIAVAYRIYPKVSKTPPVFPNDKLGLSRFCLESFKKSLGDLRVKMYVLLDGCPPEYESLFREFFKEEDLVCIHLQSIGNKATYRMQIDILKKQSDAEVVYFAEDDYFYIKDIKNMFNVVKEARADFVSPYEHPSCYTDNHVIRKDIYVIENQRYITVQHACLTFMTRRAVLVENEKILLLYSDWFASDFTMWSTIALGYDFFKYASWVFKKSTYTLINLKVFGTMILYGAYRFLTNKRYIVFMPIDTFATHLESNFLSPGINWDIYFKNAR